MKVKNTKSKYIPVPGWGNQFFLGPKHSYWWKDDPAVEVYRPLSGITSVLKAIGGPKTDSLLGWAARCAVEHIQEAGVLDTAVLEAAKKAHLFKRDGAADVGKKEHAHLEEYIKRCISENGGIPIQIDYDNPPSQRVTEVYEWAINERVTFLDSESPLADPDLAIAGTPDFVASQKDATGAYLPGFIIGDLKTGKGIYDRSYFAQMAAYHKMYSKHHYYPNNSTDYGRLVILHAPASVPNQPMKAHWSKDVEGDWKAFESALYLHRWLGNFQP